MVVGRISPTASAIFKKDGFRSDAMLNKVMNFLRDEEGATAVEYGLIVGLIAVVLIVILGVLGGGQDNTTGLGKLFKTVSDKVGAIGE